MPETEKELMARLKKEAAEADAKDDEANAKMRKWHESEEYKKLKEAALKNGGKA